MESSIPFFISLQRSSDPGPGPIALPLKTPGLLRNDHPLRYALISDIHGNLQALDAVLEAIDDLDVDRLYCLGDIVGYGAKPGECIQRIREVCQVVLLGNHDAAAVGRTPADYFNPIARAAIEWTINVLSTEEADYLKGLPLLRNEESLNGTHATHSDPESWGYIFSTFDAAIEFELFKGGLLFYGHTHYPIVFEREGVEKEIRYRQVDELSLDGDSRYLVNVGSVGQPRDGNPDACFLVFDGGERTIKYHRVPYDIEGSQRDILETEIPRELAQRLSIGR